MQYTAGFDSADYRQQTIFRNRQHTTRGLIGAGVRTDNFSNFSKTYTKAISAVFDEFGIKQERPVYCAAEISAMLGPRSLNKELEALELFLKEMYPAINQVHIFYTYLFRLDTV
ncbi:hypothetical protein HY546_02820, partial [archaeon]|nr:hypothetical protein [archaeon]